MYPTSSLAGDGGGNSITASPTGEVAGSAESSSQSTLYVTAVRKSDLFWPGGSGCTEQEGRGDARDGRAAEAEAGAFCGSGEDWGGGGVKTTGAVTGGAFGYFCYWWAMMACWYAGHADFCATVGLNSNQTVVVQKDSNSNCPLRILLLIFADTAVIRCLQGHTFGCVQNPKLWHAVRYGCIARRLVAHVSRGRPGLRSRQHWQGYFCSFYVYIWKRSLERYCVSHSVLLIWPATSGFNHLCTVFIFKRTWGDTTLYQQPTGKIKNDLLVTTETKNITNNFTFESCTVNLSCNFCISFWIRNYDV